MKISSLKSLNNLNKNKKKNSGRNNQGRITVRHQGGGHKRIYRPIDWKREVEENVVVNFEYDPNRSAYIAKLSSIKEDGKCTYIIAPKGLKVFDKISAINTKIANYYFKIGDSSILQNFEIGDFLNSVESIPGQGAVYARSAGSFCQLLENYSVKYAKVRLPSGNIVLLPIKSKATLGIVSRLEHNQEIIGKAGRSRWLNKRPTVRGVAMNPVDHPHGGGQGKTKGGRPSVTAWSWPTKGQPTRSPRKSNKLIISKKKH